MKILPIIALGVLVAGTTAFAEPGKPAPKTTGTETTDIGVRTTTTGTETTDIGVRTTTTGTELDDIGVRSSDGTDKGVRKKPGRTTYSPVDDGGGKPAGKSERKKMEKLPAAEAEPLELMDETDPCPTLPC